MNRVAAWVKRLLSGTPYEARRRLPSASLSPLDLLLAAWRAKGDEIVVVQVGAFDGEANDPLGRFLAGGNVRAVLVEPNPVAFQRLRQVHAARPPVALVQAALGPSDGEAPFYRVRPDAPHAASRMQAASFDRDHLRRHGIPDADIERITVPCRTLASLVAEQSLGRVDLLQIDAEGFDAEIVRMALDLAVPPAVLNFEHIHLPHRERPALFRLLEAKGYLLGYDAMNLLAVRRDLPLLS